MSETIHGVNGASHPDAVNGNLDKPTHPNLISVERGAGNYNSRAVSLVDLAPNAVFSKIQGSSATGMRTYTTVQAAKDADIELNSDLVYCNHSCDPSLVFDMTKMEVRVGERPLTKGEDLTFFYPSTEWNMSQPFTCSCGAKGGRCLETVKGAKYLSPDVLQRYWLNQHIKDLLAEEKSS